MKKTIYTVLFIVLFLAASQTQAQTAVKVDTLFPSAGSIAGGDSISLIGEGFKGDSIVNLFFKGTGYLNGQAVSYKTHSDTLIRFATTPQSKAKTDTFYLEILGGKKLKPVNPYFNFKKPEVSSLSHDSSSLSGGDTITIYGKYFLGADQVYFGSAPVTPFNVSSDSLQAASPSYTKGSTNVQVRVVNTKSTVNNNSQFYYAAPQPKLLSPNSSTVKGKDTIAIRGKYMNKATYVKFGDAGVVPLSTSANLVTVINPPHTSGKVPVTVEVAGQYSSSTTAPKFTYESDLPDSNYTLSLSNLTGLGTDYKIYVLGYSTNSKKMLTLNSSDSSASFTAMTTDSGYVESFELGTQVNKIYLSNKNPIVGARIYFFVANTTKSYTDNSNKTSNGNLGFKYKQSGAAVYQVKNPPQSAFPQYSYIEATFKSNQGLYIDISTVDGFFFPLSILAQDKKGKELDRIGQNNGISSNDVINAYQPFLNNHITDNNTRKAFEQLVLTTKEGSQSLINPGLYLENENSILETIFDETLNSLFSDASLKMNIWQNGNKGFQAYYDVTPVASATFGKSGNSHPALKFKSGTEKPLYVFNPVGFSVVSYLDSKGARSPIMGHIKNKTLYFSKPLPADVGLVEGMYVNNGGGSTDGTTRIKTINKSGGKIISVELNSAADYPSQFQYKFAKAPTNYYMSSGQMTYAGIGLFADGVDRYTNKNLQVVVNGLENQISTAINRGVALKAPSTADKDKKGRTTLTWAQETSWYPGNKYQNYFSYFMHVATSTSGVHLFSLPKDSVKSASGDYMAKAYGFAYDENPNPLGGYHGPQVPSEFPGHYPKGTVKLELILGPRKQE